MAHAPRIQFRWCWAPVPWVALAVTAGGCNRSAPGNSTPSQEAPLASRQIVALGRLEPAGGIISISAVPGERLKNFAAGVVEGAAVAAGAELARVSSFDLRQTQVEAAAIKLDVARRQRKQEQAAAQAQLEQSRAGLAQAEAKHEEALAQRKQLDNLAEAAAIAEEDYQELVKLHDSDPELVTERQLRRRRNAVDRATKEYESAAASYPHALDAAARAVDAAKANVRLAQENLELATKVDQSVAIEMERKVAEESRDQSILRAPQVEGGSTQFSVLRILMQPGEFVAQIPILEIGDLSRMGAIAEVYEADAKEIVVGQSATIRSPAFAGKFGDGASGSGGIRGKVTRVGTMISSPGLSNRNPLAPSDRSVVEVVVEIDPGDKEATGEASRRIGLQVTVEFDEKPASSK
jgi:HlyD family secretion protein